MWHGGFETCGPERHSDLSRAGVRLALNEGWGASLRAGELRGDHPFSLVTHCRRWSRPLRTTATSQELQGCDGSGRATMLSRRLLHGAASPRLCQCSAVRAPRAILPGQQLWWVARAGRSRRALGGGVRPRWQSTGAGASRSAAPVGASGGGEDPDPKKKAGWRDMDPTLVKHGAQQRLRPRLSYSPRWVSARVSRG